MAKLGEEIALKQRVNSIYLLSLPATQKRTSFIHVPDQFSEMGSWQFIQQIFTIVAVALLKCKSKNIQQRFFQKVVVAKTSLSSRFPKFLRLHDFRGGGQLLFSISAVECCCFVLFLNIL